MAGNKKTHRRANQMLTKKQMIERAKARLSSGIENALGFQIDIDTLTGIKAKVTRQYKKSVWGVNWFI